MTKKVTAIFAAILLAVTMTFSAFADTDSNASDLDFDKKAITDAVFLYDWDVSGGSRVYERLTDESVKISEDPFAALLYTDVEDFIKECDTKELLSISPDSNLDVHDLHQKYNSWFRTRYSNHESSDWGLTLVFEYKVYDYEDEAFIIDTSNEKYQRVKFIDNGDSFTMVTADETEEIGTYKKVYGFDDTDEDAGGAGGSGGTAGGGSGSGTNGKTGSTSVAGNSKNNDSKVSTSSSKSTVNGTANTESDDIEYDKPESYNTSAYTQGNNPAVTPEIVSTVDALKDAANEKTSSAVAVMKNDDGSVDSGNTVTNVIILIVALGVIAGVVVLFLKKEKKN